MATRRETDYQLAALLASHRRFIRRRLARFGVCACDVEDVQQEVEHQVARGLACFDPSRSVKPERALESWLFAICERVAAGYHRSRARCPELLAPATVFEHVKSPVPSAESILESAEEIALLRSLLGSLRAERREVLVAYELDGLSMAEVAAALRIPLNTAWNRLRLARADLRREALRTKREGGARREGLPVGGRR